MVLEGVCVVVCVGVFDGVPDCVIVLEGVCVLV